MTRAWKPPITDLPLFKAPPDFDGETYERELDHPRLETALGRVLENLKSVHRVWWTLADLAREAKTSEAGASARLRDLRKEKFGGYEVVSRRVDGGLWEYALARRTQ